MDISTYHKIEEEEEETESLSTSDKSLPSNIEIQVFKNNDNLSDSLIEHSNLKYQHGKSPRSLNSKNIGTLPTPQKVDKIFQRLISQLDFLNKTISMMTYRMDILQKDIDNLKQENNIE